jgi:hypothetical protein
MHSRNCSNIVCGYVLDFYLVRSKKGKGDPFHQKKLSTIPYQISKRGDIYKASIEGSWYKVLVSNYEQV